MNQIRLTAGVWFVIGMVAGKLIQEVVCGTYQDGQVDALHGKWSYRLKTNQVEVVERVKE